MDESRRGGSLASASLRNPQAPVVASVRATPRTPPSSTHLFLFLSPPGFSPASHAVQETDGRTKPPLTLRTRAKSRLAHASKTLKLPRLKSGLDADAGHQAQKGASACCLHRRAPGKQQASFLASDVHSRIVVPVRLPYAFFSAHIICLPGVITLPFIVPLSLSSFLCHCSTSQFPLLYHCNAFLLLISTHWYHSSSSI